MSDPLTLAEEVVDACNVIMEEIDNDGAYEFAEGVKETALGIQGTIESKDGYATDKQIVALENMMHGCERWLERLE